MRKLPVIALAGLSAVAIAGAAVAGTSKTHLMTVSLPDGSVAQVEYLGNVAPKVTVVPASPASDDGMFGAIPQFAGFDRMFEQMNRQAAALIGQAQQMTRQGVGTPAMNVASFGNLPSGADSVSVVTVSNNGVSCTRTTEVVSQGAGKPPKVTNSVSGKCGASTAPVPQAAPGTAPAALDRT